MTRILVDADACPVKAEVFRVAGRHGLEVILVANSWMRTPLNDRVRLQVVKGELDAADDWIADQATPDDIVITADIPLAARCLSKEAVALKPNGQFFTNDMIGDALATREILSEMREAGVFTGGPPAFQKKDRSRFLQSLEQAIRSPSRRLS